MLRSDGHNTKTLQKLNVLIIGAGAISETLGQSLLSSGAKVTLVTNQVKAKQNFSSVPYLNVTNRDDFLLESTIYSVDIVIFAARPDRWEDSTTLSKLLRRLLKLKPRQIILLSSSAIYGDSPIPFSETTLPTPVNHYGKSRLDLENVFKDFYQESQLTILRISNVFGHHKLNSIVEEIARLIKNSRYAELDLDPQILRDYLHIEDLILSLMMCILDSTEGCFNVSSGIGVSGGSLVSLVNDRFALKFTTKMHHNLQNVARCVVLDNSKFRVKFSWSPREPLSGISGYIESYIGR